MNMPGSQVREEDLYPTPKYVTHWLKSQFVKKEKTTCAYMDTDWDDLVITGVALGMDENKTTAIHHTDLADTSLAILRDNDYVLATVAMKSLGVDTHGVVNVSKNLGVLSDENME